MPGLEKTLEKIKKVKAVVSSGPKDIIEETLKNLSHYFSCIITAEDTDQHKPHPEPLLKACQKLSINPKECIYIGDHLRDSEAAKNAKMEFLGFLSGATTKEEFKRAGAEKTINSLEELIGIN